MPICLLGIGSNLGDRRENLEAAVDRLGAHAAIQTDRVSHWIATTPLGGPEGQAEFLNGAVRVQTSLAPLEVLDFAQQIERELGRRRQVRWDARPIDIDILLYDELVCEHPRLSVPHPWLAVRRFVLQPAAEIGGELLHPRLGWTLNRLNEHALNALPRFAVCGATWSEWQQLEARFLAEFGRRAVTICPPEPFGAADVSARSDQEPSLQQHLDRLVAASWNSDSPHQHGESPIMLAGFWLPQVVERLRPTVHGAPSNNRTAEATWDNEVASAKLVFEVVRGTPASVPDSRDQAIPVDGVRALSGLPANCPYLQVADRGTLTWIDQVIAAIKMMEI